MVRRFVILTLIACGSPCLAAACGGARHSASFGPSDGGASDEVGTFEPGHPPQCQGLQCSAVDCAASGRPPTTIRGRVYDPAGARPLYNVYVYIPNTTPDPIPQGHPTCTSCQAPASGSPIVGALTDENGEFVLEQSTAGAWGVPSGSDIPLVLQIGKWRRQVRIPVVNECAENVLPDPPEAAAKLRLPAQSSEGDMPLIAFISGCDPAECFLRDVGIAESEFVPPGGNGHVHFYTGKSVVASSITGGNSAYQTYEWWSDEANLRQYDIVFAACECAEVYRGGYAYDAMKQYLNEGGRFYTTHYHYNWFAPPAGPDDFESVADWQPEKGPQFPNYFADTSFPKGKAFADWLQGTGTTTTYGQIDLSDTRSDVATITPKATRWVYAANAAGDAAYATSYLSFNTPVGADTPKQCGRAVFSDVHLSGSSNAEVFPHECATQDPAYATNEKALEFLFFDLASCVQDDTKPPPPPPPK